MSKFHVTAQAALMASVAALALSPRGAALAQTAAPAPGEVVVTGIKRSNQTAVAAKLQYQGVADVVSANEVQALPDLTTVETLRRVPGVTVLPTLDNEHPRDETATPVIRGLGAAYNNVTIDGSPIASPGTPNGNLGSVGRGVRLDILPSSMISELAVIKTFSANQDPNAVGGAIDLKTRSAFDRGGRAFFTVESAVGGASDVGKPRDQDRLGARLVTTGSLTIGAAQQFGLVVSANYQKLDTTTDTHMTTDTIHETFYDATGTAVTGAATGNGYAVPQNDKYWYVQDSRSRYGLTAKLEARTGAVYAFLTGGDYVFRDDMVRNENIIDARARGVVLNQTPTSGAYPGGDVEVGYSRQVMTSKTALAQAGLDWRRTVDEVLSLRADVSRATFREPIAMIKYSTGNTFGKPGTTAGASPGATPAYGFTYDTSGLNQSFNVAPSAWYNLANYKLLYYRPDYLRTATDQVANGRLDYRHRMTGAGIGYAAGISYTEDRPSYSVYRDDFEPNTSAVLGTLADAAGPFGPRLRYNLSGLNLLTIDPDRAIALAKAVRAAGGLNATDQSSFSNQDNFEHREQIFGAYAMGRYAGGPVTAQAGLHYDSTDQNTTGRAKVAGVWVKAPTSSSYDFLLPSALLIYQATPAIDVRLGASQTIGRPTYDSYAARSSISFANAADLGNGAATGVTVSVGNPDIKPRRSTNLDLSVNWRLPRALNGLVSLTLFDKDIKDEIFNSSSVGFTYQGVTYANAVVTKPVNASKASISGVEASVIVNSLGVIHPLVRDFGFSANAAFLDGQIDVLQSNKAVRRIDRLVGQSDTSRNLTLFYSRAGLELRAAYNYQGRALRSITPDISWQDLYWAPREQIDVHASYQIRPGVVLFAQAQNLTHTRLTSVLGYSANVLKDTYSVPTIYWAGVRYSFGQK